MKFKLKDFASTYGIKEGTVKSWIHRNKLQKDSEGLIDNENDRNKLFILEMQLKVGGSVNKNKSAVSNSKKTNPEENDRTASEQIIIDLDLRKKYAETEKFERDAELKKLQLEKLAGKLLPVELVEKIFTINIQAVFKNLESENENLASLYVIDRSELAIVMEKQKVILSKAISKAKEDAMFEIESAIMDYQDVRSRGEKK